MGAVFNVWAWIVLAGKGIFLAWITAASVGTRTGGTADPPGAVWTEMGTLIVPATVERGRHSLSARAMGASDRLGRYWGMMMVSPLRTPLIVPPAVG